MRTSLILLLSMFSLSIVAQEEITLNLKNENLSTIVKAIEKQTDVGFVFSKEKIDLSKKASIKISNAPLDKVLKQLFDGTNIQFKRKGKTIILFPVKKKKTSVYGIIRDGTTGEPLPGANVFIPGRHIGTISDQNGFYSLEMDGKQDTVIISFVGYSHEFVEYSGVGNKRADLELHPTLHIRTVDVNSSYLDAKLHSTETSTSRVDMKEMENLPLFLGEPDLIRILQLMPGVQTGTEGSEGMHVRGGNADQNLVLIDGVPIYNVFHMLGFFTTFNNDVLSSAKLYKGSFPAKFGGRLSSVLDVKVKEGNMKELKGNISIGNVASRITLEGPIVKDKISFIGSFRRTYVDYMIRGVMKMADLNETPNVSFYDFNGKINWKISQKNKLAINAYTGIDNMGFDEENSWFKRSDVNSWGNKVFSAKLTSILTPKLILKSCLSSSNYLYQYNEGIKDELGQSENIYYSGINNLRAAADFRYALSLKHKIEFGTSVTKSMYKPVSYSIKAKAGSSPFFEMGGLIDRFPYEYRNLEDGGSIRILSRDIDTTLIFNKNEPKEYHVYLSDNIKLSENHELALGLNYSAYTNDSVSLHNINPRINYRWLINKNLSFKTSLSTVSQYDYLLLTKIVSVHNNIWIPLSGNLKPQEGYQATTGIVWKKGQFLLSLEGYYKKMHNVLELKEGEFLTKKGDWSKLVTQGKGEAYGAEILLEKNTGRLTGWLGYSLGWANRQFDDLNLGRKYPYMYDCRHNISVVGTYKIKDHILASLTWVYSSGKRMDMPLHKFPDIRVLDSPRFNGNGTQYHYYYPSKNNFQLPAYHRLDIGFRFEKDKKRGTRAWCFGAYNAYSHNNIQYLSYQGKNDEIINNKHTVWATNLAPIVPYVSFNFKF